MPLIIFLTVMLSLLFSGQAFAEKLHWAGCGITKHAFMEEIVSAFAEETGIEIDLIGGGATKGIRGVSNETIDVGGSCRHRLQTLGGIIHSEERNARLVHVAWDAIVPITHKGNPIHNVSIENLIKIYNGEIAFWNELGVSITNRIILCKRAGRHSGIGHMLRLFLFHDPAYEFDARALTFKSSDPLERKISTTKAAFGVTGISSAKKRNVKVLSLNNVFPSKKNIVSGKYPFFRPLFITVNKERIKPEIKQLVDFILSPKGQKIISDQGTVNLKEGKALEPLWKKKKTVLGLL